MPPRSDRTRARLLDAALALFSQQGYDDVVLGDITQRAGLGTGTLYVHYRDKRDLYEAVVRRALRRLAERWREIAAPELDPFDQVELMVAAFIELFVTADPRAARLFLLEGPAVEGFIVEDVGRGIAGVIAPKVDHPELVANMVAGLALGAARWYLRGRRRIARKTLLQRARACCRPLLDAASYPTTRRPRKAPARARASKSRRKETSS